MVPKKHQQSVRVLITTYKPDLDRVNNKMDLDNRHGRTNTDKFICSICLNTKGRNNGKVSCTACQKRNNADTKDTTKREGTKSGIQTNKAKSNVENHNNKAFINQDTDFSQGLNLLNEVLTVFKSKKQNLHNSKSSKTLIFKDVGTSTDNHTTLNAKPKLTLSKVFLCSIEGKKGDENYKFTIVNSSQPEHFKKERIIDLKYKSSSIPQMRIDEMKNSLKEKSKSKDITEEVNRMFAVVTTNSNTKVSDHSNRPVTRKGPRVLPVVKTKLNQDINFKQTCRCCQTNEYCLSSGDSLVKPNINQKTWQKSDNIPCRHCQTNHRRTQTDAMVCQNCLKVTEKHCGCEKSFQTNYCDNIE